jgi:predicted nucleic acid-binding protein
VTLLDTSVVIDYLRTGDPRLLALFTAHDAAVCGITRAEVLNGARDPSHRHRLVAALNTFRQVPIPDPVWDTVGDHLAALRGAGVTVPFADVIIGTLAIVGGVELWTRDAQFQLIQGVLPQLRLFQEPP